MPRLCLAGCAAAWRSGVHANRGDFAGEARAALQGKHHRAVHRQPGKERISWDPPGRPPAGVPERLQGRHRRLSRSPERLDPGKRPPRSCQPARSRPELDMPPRGRRRRASAPAWTSWPDRSRAWHHQPLIVCPAPMSPGATPDRRPARRSRRPPAGSGLERSAGPFCAPRQRTRQRPRAWAHGAGREYPSHWGRPHWKLAGDLPPAWQHRLRRGRMRAQAASAGETRYASVANSLRLPLELPGTCRPGHRLQAHLSETAGAP